MSDSLVPHPRQNAAGLCAQQFTLATVSDSLVAHPHQNAAGLCAQQFTLATVSDSLVAHPCQNAAGLCADQQQFHCSTLFCFYLIPIKMLLVCVDINNLQCRTLFYLILIRMLLVYVLVNNSVSFLSPFLPHPHQCAASVCGMHNSFRPYFTLSPSVCCWFVCYRSSVSLLYILFYGQNSAGYFCSFVLLPLLHQNAALLLF